jgi:hypothetical protein
MNNKISNNGHVDIGDKFTHLIGGGIYLLKSLNNKIYLNDFINNSLNGPFSFNSTNTWNSTEEITYTYNGTTYESYTGNYWDGYKGKDDNNELRIILLKIIQLSGHHHQTLHLLFLPYPHPVQVLHQLLNH